MSGKTDFERAVEVRTGKTVEDIRETPIDEQREVTELIHDQPMEVISGKGGFVELLSGKDVDNLVDEALR